MKFISTILVLLLAGCAASSPKDRQLAIELTEKSKKNIVEVMCTQAVYTTCFKQTQEQCVARFSPHRQLCEARAHQTEGVPASKNEWIRFVTAMEACLVVRAFPFESEKEIEEAKACQKRNPIDKDMLLKKLIQ